MALWQEQDLEMQLYPGAVWDLLFSFQIDSELLLWPEQLLHRDQLRDRYPLNHESRDSQYGFGRTI